MSIWQNFYAGHAKGILDKVIASFGLLFLAPLFFIVALLIKIDSPGPIFFRHNRIGLNGRTFALLKFRSMVVGASNIGPSVTQSGDMRVTRVGSFLRKFKVDELPQLINVLLGDMSLVGPRPEVAKYVFMFREEYNRILTVKPGITDYAAIEFRDEEEYLATFDNLEEAYTTQVLPRKIELYTLYVQNISLGVDMLLICKTLCRIAGKKRSTTK